MILLHQATIQWWWDGGPEIKEGVSAFATYHHHGDGDGDGGDGDGENAWSYCGHFHGFSPLCVFSNET